MIRNLSDETEVKQFLTQTENSNYIPVKYFQEAQNKFKIIGYITRDNDVLNTFIQRFSPWDIRII